MLFPHHTLDGAMTSKSASPSAPSGQPKKCRFNRPSWGQPVREISIPAGAEDDTFSRKKETLEYLRRQQEEQAWMARAAGLRKPVKTEKARKEGADSEDSGSDAAEGKYVKGREGKSRTEEAEKPRKKRRLNSDGSGESSSGNEGMDFKPAVEGQQQSSAQREDPVKREPQHGTKAGEQETPKRTQQKTVIVDLDSSDSDKEAVTKPPQPASPHKPSVSPSRSLKSNLQGGHTTHSRSPSPYKPEEYSPSAKPPSQPITIDPAQAVKAPSEPPQSDATVRLYIHSRIPDTVPLVVCRRLSQRVKECLQAWLQRQTVLTPEQKSEIFLTWRGFRVYSNTSCKGLGLQVNDMSEVCYKGKLLTPEEGDEETGAQLVFEAVTQEIVQEDKRRKEDEKRQLEARAKGEKTVKAKKEEGDEGIKIILRARGLDDFRLKVRKVCTTLVGLLLHGNFADWLVAYAVLADHKCLQDTLQA